MKNESNAPAENTNRSAEKAANILCNICYRATKNLSHQTTLDYTGFIAINLPKAKQCIEILSQNNASKEYQAVLDKWAKLEKLVNDAEYASPMAVCSSQIQHGILHSLKGMYSVLTSTEDTES